MEGDRAAIQSWETYLGADGVGPVVKYLTEQGLSIGDAILAIETNALRREVRDMCSTQTDLARSIDFLTQSLRDEAGEEWREGG